MNEGGEGRETEERKERGRSGVSLAELHQNFEHILCHFAYNQLIASHTLLPVAGRIKTGALIFLKILKFAGYLLNR